MLTEEKISSNAKRYYDVGRKQGFLTDELITFLGAEFVKAPAATKTEFVGCYDGGLIDYTFQVAKHMINANKNLSEPKRVDEGKIMKVAFLHQIGKAKLFKTCDSEWHRNNQGKMYEFNDDLVSMRVSERSIFYAISNGVNLTEEEYQAILNYDKSCDDVQSRVYNSDLGRLLRIGNDMTELEKRD